MRLLILTQCWEQYGERWKPKSGSEYVVEVGSAEEIAARQDVAGYLRGTVKAAQVLIEGQYGSGGYAEEVVDWQLLEEGEKTPTQKEYEEYGGMFGYAETYKPREVAVEGGQARFLPYQPAKVTCEQVEEAA